MPRRQPERMIDDAARAVFLLGERWWTRCIFARLSEIRLAMQCGSKMSRACRREQGFVVARSEYEVMNDLSKKHWFREFPRPPGRIAAKNESAFACADQNGHWSF